MSTVDNRMVNAAYVWHASSAYSLSSLSTNTTSQLDVFWHDGHALRVDSAQVGVLEQSDEICLAGLLQHHINTQTISCYSYSICMFRE